MAAISEYIQQIDDPALRQKIQEEVDKLTKQKKFGLVFEEHLPERTPLYDLPIKKGSRVALKSGEINTVYTVISISFIFTVLTVLAETTKRSSPSGASLPRN